MKSSKRKIESSRENGRKSKGPATPEGKHRSSYNAVQHGMLAQCVVLVNENRGHFETLVQQFVTRFAPLDDVEFGMVEEMAAATWRMRRGWITETQLMDQAILRQKADGSEKDEFRAFAAAFKTLASEPALALLHRYETRLSRLYQRALRNLLTLRDQKALQKQELTEATEPEVEEFQRNPIPISTAPKPAPSTPENPPAPAVSQPDAPETTPKLPPGGVAA